MYKINQAVTSFVTYLAGSSFIYGFLFCMVESFLPFLPLGLFIGLNIKAYGKVIGFLISFLGSLCGNIMSFLIFRKIAPFVYKHFPRLKEKAMKFKKVSFNRYTTFFSLPFAPSFIFNILAGLSGLNFKNFIISRTISTLSIIIFWSFIGASFIDALKNPIKLLYTTIIIVICYILSKLVSKKLDVNIN